MKHKIFQDLAAASEVNDLKNPEIQNRFILLAQRALIAIRDELKHEKATSFSNKFKATLETNRVFIKIEKICANDPYEITYRVRDGVNKYISIKSVANDPELFLDFLREAEFCH